MEALLIKCIETDKYSCITADKDLWIQYEVDARIGDMFMGIDFRS